MSSSSSWKSKSSHKFGKLLFLCMLIACKCTPLCKNLDCDVKSDPLYFATTRMDGFIVCNVDDIFIFSKNMEDHECLVLDKLEEVKFYAILKKCEFYQTKVEFLGMTFSGIPIWFKPLWIGLPQPLFMTFNVFLDSLTFMYILLHIIPQYSPLLLIQLGRINLNFQELKLILPSNLWRFISWLPH